MWRDDTDSSTKHLVLSRISNICSITQYRHSSHFNFPLYSRCSSLHIYHRANAGINCDSVNRNPLSFPIRAGFNFTRKPRIRHRGELTRALKNARNRLWRRRYRERYHPLSFLSRERQALSVPGIPRKRWTSRLSRAPAVSSLWNR